MSPTLVIALLTAAAAIGLTAYWITRYDIDDFRGHGPLRDTGVFSYYRYHAPLGSMALAKPGTHVMKFLGVPSVKMALMLYFPSEMAPIPEPTFELLRSLRTTLTAEIVDSRGKVICRGIGTPAGRDISNEWRLMSSSNNAAYWHQACRDVPLLRQTDYELRLSVEDVDPRSPPLQISVMLEGGGIELAV
jgi:hypothetical protein